MFLLSLESGYARVARPPSFFPNGESRPYFVGLSDDIIVGELIEHRLDTVAFAEYRVLDSVGVNVTGRINAGLNDAVIQLVENANVDPAGRSRDNLKFSRFEAYVGLRWFL
jgi:hypothetical protein